MRPSTLGLKKAGAYHKLAQPLCHLLLQSPVSHQREVLGMHTHHTQFVLDTMLCVHLLLLSFEDL